MTPTQRKAPMFVTDEENEKFSEDVSNFNGADPEATMYALEQFLKRRAALAEPAPEPVAHLWQHGETGRTRVVMPDSVTDCGASWQLIGPLYLAAPVREPAHVPLLTDEEIAADASRHWSEDGVDPVAFARTIEALVRQEAGL